jgi:HAD domain in Swiss Army Knife RNA repair proteins
VKKVLFLDFDGVLNDDTYLRRVREQGLVQGLGLRDPSDRHMLDPARIALLDSLLALSGVDVVLSTSWRMIYTTDELKEFLRLQGMQCVGKIIGRTKNPINHVQRGVLIRLWLDDHPEYTHHVALDDDPGAAECDVKLVQTDPLVGLTDDDVETALKILGVELGE